MTVTFSNFEDVLTATSGGVVNVGDPMYSTAGDLMGFAMTAATASGQLVTYRIWGTCIGVAKSTAHAWRVGDALYWDAVNLVATRTPTGHRLGRANAAATAGAATGDVVVDAKPGTCLFQIVAASTAISNVNTETTFSNGTFTIPANFLTDGTVLRVRGRATITAHNATDTLNVKIKLGGNQIIASGAIQNAANDVCAFDAFVTVRLSGASGTFIGSGYVADGVAETATAKVDACASTSIDTTATQAVTVTATWSAANAGDSVRLDEFVVELVR